MKNLPLHKPQNKRLLHGFQQWLTTTGYAQTTVYNTPLMIREYLHFLEAQKVQNLEHSTQYLPQYLAHLQTRKNQRRTSALSTAHINKHIQALKRFSYYLQSIHGIFAPVKTPYLVAQPPYTEVLTTQEIKSLYQVTQHLSPRYASRACTILDIFYGCGLRRREGVKLALSDVQLDSRTLHVRFGKAGKQRKVPFTKEIAQRFEQYIQLYRHQFLRTQDHPQLLLSFRGKPIQGQACLSVLKKLQKQSQLPSLKVKNIGLHTLRHSIATHLLSSGMDIHLIKKFLGHASLESTQIYTHLASRLRQNDDR